MSTIIPATADSRATMPAGLPPRGTVTLAMYDRMIAAGVFEPRQEHPLELIEGVLQMMSPIGDRHADAVDWLVRWSMTQVDLSRILVRGQNPDRDPCRRERTAARSRLGDAAALHRSPPAPGGRDARCRGRRHEP